MHRKSKNSERESLSFKGSCGKGLLESRCSDKFQDADSILLPKVLFSLHNSDLFEKRTTVL